MSSRLCKNVHWLGVFARDKVPQIANIKEYPCTFIANTDTSNQPGMHWVAFFLDSPYHVEFFDSYGFPSFVYGFTYPVHSYSPLCLQSDKSNVCGHYCIFYVISRSLCRSLTCILSHFSLKDSKRNDIEVRQWLRSILKHRHPVPCSKPITCLNQHCQCKSSCHVN
jgi:hypothetical protein